ncbi:Glycoside hydrolase [Flavobacterium anhuiense]|uniref:Glycoside hydrolase n=1 Tax=Flavobacterium anhuiense TaxID=459526 RepID=A0A444VY53_9FLAO|nr:Glycoside hydrolase [Flavobacterium anhuiense]
MSCCCGHGLQIRAIGQKIDVKKEIWKDPFIEKINSYLTVNIGGYWADKNKGKCVCKENNFYWSNKLTCDERKKVLEVCAKLWGEDKKKDKASELMAIMHLETGEKNMFKPYADNGADYSGLIQFSDVSAKKLGTTRAELKKMTFIKQMDYVHDYFASKKEISNMVDLYLYVLKPNAVGNGNNPDYVLFDESISVPDGDGSQTSAKQRGINIGIEPWVTKYGYSSNPSFMKGEEHTQRKKWVYTRQRFEDRWGFINGKTTVADVILELKEKHYDPGAKELFKGICENAEEGSVDISDRAPWMEVAVNEAKIYGGKKQNLIQDRVTMYHKEGASYLGKKDAWCSSFACWCLENSNPDYPSPHSPGSRSFINNKTVEKCEVFYGAIATFSDCNKNGIVESSGHVTFVYGKINGTDNYAVLGGNQNNMIKVSSYDCSGNVFHSHYSAKKKRDVYKKFMGFFKPKGYQIKTTEKLTASDVYSNPDEANKSIGLSSIKTVKGEKDD